MALDIIQRRAIWEVHGKRCAYCREHLLFRDLEIDHIIPRDSFESSEKWRQAKEEQGLSEQFDPEGYENLMPSCGTCNRRKLAQMLAPGRIGIELTIAEKYAIQIRDAVQNLIRADQHDRIRLAIATALASGVSHSEVEKFAANGNDRGGIFRLSPGAWIFEDQPLGELTSESYEANLDRPVVLDDGSLGLELARDFGERLTVTTLREFVAAIADGYFANTRWSRTMAYRYFEAPLKLLSILKVAVYSEKSFIRDPYAGLSDLELLPATLLWLAEDMTSDEAFAGQRERLRGLTIRDMLQRGATVEEVGSRMLAVHYDGGRTYLLEMLRADVDGDGIEEIVLHKGCGPIEGTYSTGSLVVLARRSESSKFEVASLS